MPKGPSLLPLLLCLHAGSGHTHNLSTSSLVQWGRCITEQRRQHSSNFVPAGCQPSLSAHPPSNGLHSIQHPALLLQPHKAAPCSCNTATDYVSTTAAPRLTVTCPTLYHLTAENIGPAASSVCPAQDQLQTCRLLSQVGIHGCHCCCPIPNHLCTALVLHFYREVGPAAASVCPAQDELQACSLLSQVCVNSCHSC